MRGNLVWTGQKKQERETPFLAVTLVQRKIRLLHHFVTILYKCLIKRKK